MSHTSETSTRSSRAFTRKRAQTVIKKKSTAKQVGLRKKTNGNEEEEEDSELASPPIKQAKTRTKAQSNLPNPELMAEKMRARPIAEINMCIDDSLKVIEEVANSSRNLKGSFVHNLKVAVTTVRSAVQVNFERLEIENAELKSKLAGLSAQVEKLTGQVSLLNRRRDVAEINEDTPQDMVHEVEAQFRRSIALEIGGMVDAKLAALESRLLPEKRIRPPLANDAIKFVAAASVAQAEPISNPNPLPKPAKNKGKGKVKGKVVAPVVELPAVATTSSQATQVAPPTVSEAWSTVVGRKAKKSKTQHTSVKTGGSPATTPSSSSKKANKQIVKLPRVPSTAAITVSVKEGTTTTLAEVMTVVRQRIRLSDIGLDSVGQKRAADGGIVLSIAGTDASSKADLLAGRMREVLAEFDVRIARPTKRAEARVMELDDAVTQEDVKAAIAALGCSPEDITVGEIRRPPASLGHVWVRCPLKVITKLATDKHLRLGWSLVKVEVLATRRMMCFRCLEPGHVRRQCTSTVDRSTQCYACGGAHKARECKAPTLRCPLCADYGIPANHRLGSKKCAPRRRPMITPTLSQGSTAAPLGINPAEAMETSPSQP